MTLNVSPTIRLALRLFAEWLLEEGYFASRKDMENRLTEYLQESATPQEGEEV